MKRIIAFILALILMLGISACSAPIKPEDKGAENAKSAKENTVVDMRGKEVKLPAEIKRVAIIDKGFIVQTMTALGVKDLIVAEGDVTQGSKTPDRDTLLLCPALLNMPNLGYPMKAIDYEALAGAEPDIVLFRNSEYIKESEVTKEAFKKIEDDMKIPLVVINGPGCYDIPKYETQYEGVRLLGKVFGKEERAEEIVALMDGHIEMIKERTKDIKEEDKPSVMYISHLTGKELSGTIWGGDYGDAKFGAEIAHIKNVYPKSEPVRKAAAEQIMTLNPDVFMLCTVAMDPDKFLEAPVHSPLAEVNAFKNKRVISRGLLTWWGDFRLEVPTIMMLSAVGVYPELFKDIVLGKWINQYHMELYNISEEEAQQIKVAQGLGWVDG